VIERRNLPDDLFTPAIICGFRRIDRVRVYGDIAPVSRSARLLTMLESTPRVMYVSMLIARLSGLDRR